MRLESELGGTHAERGRRPWRLILPARPSAGPSTDERVQALAALSAHRGAGEPLIYDPPAGLEPELAAEAWVDEHRLFGEQALLVVGEPPEIPFSLLYALGLQHAVGWLWPRSAAELERYAAKVVVQEQAGLGGDPPPLITFILSRDRQTRVVDTALVSPLGRAFSAGQSPALTPHPVTTLRGRKATVEALLGALGAPGAAGGILLLSSHGAERQRDNPTSEDHGAPVDRTGEPISPSRLPAEGDPVLEGGVAFLLSCAAAGTPARREWGRMVPGASMAEPRRDRLGPLPMALLTHPRGPVAVIAHLDTVFTWGMIDARRQRPRDLSSPGILPFAETLGALGRRQPVGDAMAPLRQARVRAEAAAGRALRRLSEGAVAPRADGVLFPRMRWHDLRGWVVVGDPLARPAPLPR